MLKLEERIVLKTIDNQIVVRPEATKYNNSIYSDKGLYILNEKGIDAWNNGEQLDITHFSVFIDNKIILNGEF